MIGDISETQKATIDTSIRLTLDMDAIAGLKTTHHWAYLPILGLVFVVFLFYPLLLPLVVCSASPIYELCCIKHILIMAFG